MQNYESDVAVRQLGYLGLNVTKMDEWKEFAANVLGLQENGVSSTGDVLLRMDDYHHRFILKQSDQDDIAFHGWEVKDVAAFEQMIAKLRASGFEVTKGTPEEIAERMVVDLVHFQDPDGLRTEIYYGPLIDHKPFISPRGVQGFNANGLGLGHMVLAVANPDEYVNFVLNVLGAKVSDYITLSRGAFSMRLTFTHVNPRHHSLAISGRPPAAPGGPAPRRLNHIMIEANRLDDVGMAHALWQQAGLPAGNFGRHTNDLMFSFYGETPSGFYIEYGCEGLQILDEEKWEVQHHKAASLWGHGFPPPRQPAPAAA